MHCLKVFWSNLLEAFKFEILFKIICLIIILPIIKFIIDKYLWINGYNISFNSDIISRFFYMAKFNHLSDYYNGIYYLYFL